LHLGQEAQRGCQRAVREFGQEADFLRAEIAFNKGEEFEIELFFWTEHT
jgi:hypothetical protein